MKTCVNTFFYREVTVLGSPASTKTRIMDTKRVRKSAAPRAGTSSGTESEETGTGPAATSPSSLGKRGAQDDALASTDAAKKQRGRRAKPLKESESDPIETSVALVTESEATPEQIAEPVEMVVVPEVQADAAAGQTVQEQVQAKVQEPAEAPVPPKPRKGRRVRKTNLEKMEILAFVDQGGSQGAAAEKFGVSRTAVTKMVKERAAIAAQALVESASTSRKVLQYQHKLSVIEDMLYRWQMQVELDAPALKVTGELLQSKAMEFRNKILADYSSELSDDVIMSLTDFKASNGWLHRYMQRRSMRSLPKQHGQTGVAAERLSYEQRIQKIRDLLLTVPPACIWNVDELALRHRTTSARLDSVVNMDARSLERVSVAMALSAAGEKLHLQVVGKDPSPASLKDIDALSAFGIQYRDHCRAVHDTHIITDFIQTLNQEATARKQVWYLVLDSCTAHVAAAHGLNPSGSLQTGFSFESMVLLFLPPCSSGDAQPLQQGILRSFKLRFRREMLQTLLHEHEQWAKTAQQQGLASDSTGSPASDAFDVHAHTHVRNTLAWLQAAWEAVLPSFIRQAWSASLYVPALLPGDGEFSAASGEEAEISAYTELLAQLAKAPALQKALGLEVTDNPGQFMLELLDFDKSEANGVDEIAKDNEIVVESLAAQGLLRDTHRALMLESIKTDDLPLLAVGEANAAVSRLLHFMSRENDNLLTVSERRTGRANLLIVQRLLLKARERERERESTTDFTV
jgi:predicted DNA-binding protein (UPF0251 family)